ncbi:MAG: acyl-CoA desaturase [Pirellulaceae bacterium]
MSICGLFLVGSVTLEGDTPDRQSGPSPDAGGPPRFPHGVCWWTVSWLGLIHAVALAAPFCFSWSGLWVMLALYWLTGGIGICLGFHRLISHRSFTTYRPVRWLIAWIGGLAGEGSAIQWAATHRAHHALSDTAGDPHSPRRGFWWSHMLWCMARSTPAERTAMQQRWAPDLARDPVLRFLDRTFLHWHLLLAAVLGGIGLLFGGWYLACSLVVWGMAVRMVIVLHATWFINSVTHVWGYRTYDAGDDSRNLWWVALVTFGEGWHNNHHAYQRCASYWHRWWEFDSTYLTIQLLRTLGVVWDVVPIPQDPKRKLASGRS